MTPPGWDEDMQTPAELAAHYGPGSPTEAAFRWAKAIEDGDLGAAWPYTDENLRLVIAQNWVWRHRAGEELAACDIEDVVRRLASDPLADPLWSHFAADQLHELRSDGFDLGTWGAASRPRPIAVDYEVVIFVESGADVVQFEEPARLPAFRMLMHATPQGWKVAGFGERPAVASWPPAV